VNSFVKRWRAVLPPTVPVNPKVPAIDVLLAGPNRRVLRRTFLVDTGADVTLAPRRLCELLGFDWPAGEPMRLAGIASRPECAVEARLFDLEFLIPDLAIGITVPVCFADGDSSLLLGREGFFDCFRIEFDKSRLLTRFELLDEDASQHEPLLPPSTDN